MAKYRDVKLNEAIETSIAIDDTTESASTVYSSEKINDSFLALSGGTLTGGLTITAATDAVNSSKVTDKDGNVILSVDTVNDRVGIGTTSPTSKLSLSYANPQSGNVLFNIRSEAYGNDLLRIEKWLNSGGYISFVSPQGWMSFNSASTVFKNPSSSVQFQLEGGTGSTHKFSSFLGHLILETRGVYNLIFRTNEIERARITSTGNFETANDIEITDATRGIILKSPDGSRWRVKIGDDGVLTTTEI